MRSTISYPRLRHPALQRALTLTGIALLALSAPIKAQEPATRLFVEGLGGAMVPTFDIADVAKTGWALGTAVGYRLNPRWVLLGEFDYGRHRDKATGSVTINTLHYIAKLGYSLTGPRERGWESIVRRRPLPPGRHRLQQEERADHHQRLGLAVHRRSPGQLLT